MLLRSLIGNLVKVEGGPAAVIGDERREKPLVMCEGWEGAASRVIRKPEDLSECRTDASWREAIVHIKSEDKKRDIPGLIFSIRGFFFGGPHDTPKGLECVQNRI